MKVVTRMGNLVKGARGCLLALAALATISAIAIGARPWAGQTSTPLDLLAGYAGWGQSIEKSEVRNHERSDSLDFFLPQWINARSRLRSGEIPLWNDTRAGGDSALFNLTTGELTPTFAVFAAAPDPAFGFYLAIWFNLTFAGMGMFLFLRHEIGWLPAMFGGAMFQLCGFNAAWLYWTHVPTLMWAPWLLWAVHGLVRDRAPRWFLAVGICSAMLILGGFPFVSELVLGAAALYALTFSFVRVLVDTGAERLQLEFARRLALAGGGIAFGFLLAAIPLLLLAQWLGQFNLEHRPSGSFLRFGKDVGLLFAPWAFAEPRVERAMYVGTLGAILAILGFVLIGIKRHVAGHLSVYALVLTGISCVLVFQLVPSNWLTWIPGLRGSAWSRAISILDLALAISAAVFLQKILSFFEGRRAGIMSLAYVAVCCLLVGQLYDQLRYYRVFNGATDSENFYPVSRLVDQVIRTKGPFDYVVADNAYLVSGSLGGYGIREWFAHRFKSAELKAVLARMAENPFNSPTASSLPGRNILADSPEMGVMNVRYLLLRGDVDPTNTKIRGVPGGKGMKPLPPQPASSWQQPMFVKKDARLLKLSVRLATYKAPAVDGRIALEILDAGGRRVFHVEQDAAGIEDNAYFSFELGEGIDVSRGYYRMEIRYVPGPLRRPVTAWAGVPSAGQRTVLVDGRAVNRVMDFVADFSSIDVAFRKVTEDRLTALWENTQAPLGPYFVESLADLGNRDNRHVRVLEYSAEDFSLRYSGNEVGSVVVPMEISDDWHVTVDGMPARVDKVYGVLPAVKVDGAATIHFDYRPRLLQYWWAWLAIVSAVLAGIFLWHRRRSHQARWADTRG